MLLLPADVASIIGQAFAPVEARHSVSPAGLNKPLLPCHRKLLNATQRTCIMMIVEATCVL